MKNNISIAFAALALGGVMALGCSSSSSDDDGGTDGSVSDAAGGNLFGLTPGDYCFDVTAISDVMDGCDLQVSSLVGKALPVNYVDTTGTVTVGTMGSLGTGTISNNVGTLNREGDTMDTAKPTCTWHQKDMSTLTLTATNQFTLQVTETESTFSTACNQPAAMNPCTSTWTWTMKIGTKTPPSCM